MTRLVSLPRDERILRAARQRFEVAGFRHTNVAEIAADAGVATGTVYWHFTSKERLFLHLIEADNAAWLERAEAASGGPGDALERLGALAEASAKHFQDSALLLAVLRRDRQMIPAPMIEDLHNELATQNVSVIAGLLREGVAEGSIRAIDPEQTATVLFAAGHALFNQTDQSYAELSAVLADLVVRGLRSDIESAGQGA
jgi:AcrR family transcriptional regulator